MMKVNLPTSLNDFTVAVARRMQQPSEMNTATLQAAFEVYRESLSKILMVTNEELARIELFLVEPANVETT